MWQKIATAAKNVKLNTGSINRIWNLSMPHKWQHMLTHSNTLTVTNVHTHLPVENDAPDEPENQFVIPINDVCRSDIHQFNLWEGHADRQISL